MKSAEDILLVDKPKGITSFDVIRRLRKELGIRKMGHAGTLDPFATGLLIIGVGEGTKKLSQYIKLPKVYEAEVLLGITTGTGDITGDVTKEQDVEEIDASAIEKTVKGLEGRLSLPVPAYSAVKQDGEPMYKKARRGEEVKVPHREMTVRSAELYDISYNSAQKKQTVKAKFDVESGVYIRSLGEELGKRLNVPATLKELRRVSIGEFSVKDARTLKEE